MAQTFRDRFIQVFSWWQGTTFGTSFTTWLRGEFVGEDEYGNRYFRSKDGKIDPVLGFERRWVIYKGVADSTMIPPGWYGWMHHLRDVAPVNDTYRPKEWQKPHQPNLTGTPQAHRPLGSILRPDPEAKISAGYDAWSPE
ncbi:NADH:ubiquinone oxidoreductase subunit NDUFA12 [Acuticoccus kandeliae]|uniref:NADH:ubiquinone oxidoreductase subunit NDUFA12 n=1 Tax=Acuticoccus kandeliae TaxID=2073160 RepID=UPI000D3E0781|nr:NADH:ubiquinone oxidoreductase subunit NDUFA12 [Acuticoccus kandeliae]